MSMSPMIRSDTALSLRGPLHFHAPSAVTMVTIDSAATRPRRVRLTMLMLRSYGAESTCLNALVARFKITYVGPGLQARPPEGRPEGRPLRAIVRRFFLLRDVYCVGRRSGPVR